MKGIYKFYCDCGSMGSLSGVFVADSEDIQNLIGSSVDFGEVLGRHSDISGEIEKDEIIFVTDDANIVELFEKFDLETGYNPFDYLVEYEDDEENEDE